MDWLQSKGKEQEIKDISYTLMLGRSHFASRSVLTAEGNQDLERQIKLVLEGRAREEQGYLTADLDELPIKPGADLAMQELGQTLAGEEFKKKLSALAQLYIKGVELDWEKVYEGQGCRRISLPTYPFASSRHWVPEGPGPAPQPGKPFEIHPLIDRVNPWMSLNRGVVFEKRIQPGELIVKHHQVLGKPLFPAVGYLEMAIAAGTGLTGGVKTCHRLSGVYWLQPLEVPGAGKDVRVVIKPGEPGEEVLEYEIQGIEEDGDPVLHSRGILHLDQAFSPGAEAEPGAADNQAISIEKIKARATREMDRETLHTYYREMGVSYGPYYKGLVRVWGNSEEALAELELPGEYQSELENYTLHPTLADGAIQAVMGIASEPAASPGEKKTVLPYALEAVQVIRPPGKQCYAYARKAGQQRFHIDILDETGGECIRIRDLAVRELTVPGETHPGNLSSLIDTVVNRVKQEMPASSYFEESRRIFARLDRYGQNLLLDAIRRMGVFLRGGEQYEIEELREKTGIEPAYTRLLTALTGILAKAGYIEINGRTINGKPGLDNPQLSDRLRGLQEEKEQLAAQYPLIAPHLELLRACVPAYPQVLKGQKNHMDVMFPNGNRSLVENVYRGNESSDYFNRIIAGIVREYIQHKQKHQPQERLQILEVGAGTGGTSAFVLEEIKKSHQNICYFYTDISAGFTGYGREKYGAANPFAVFQVLDIEKSPLDQGYELGTMDIVIAANVLHATRQINRTLDRVRALLKPGGWLVINELTRESDFATLTFGLTEGWWMYADEDLRIKGSPLISTVKWCQLLAASGIGEIHILGPAGMEEEEWEQCVLVGENSGGAVGAVHTALEAETGTDTVPTGDIQKKTEEYVKDVFARVLKMEKAAINTRSTFENYGVDSLVVLDINKEFAKNFNKLPTTLLFENNTIELLAKYFLENHRAAVERIIGIKPAASPHQTTIKKSFSPGGLFIQPGLPRIGRECRGTGRGKQIAIIGVTGRYPGSPTIDDYWRNLQRGSGCISEIPRERWDWRKYYNPEPGAEEEGKTSDMHWGGFITEADKFDPLFFQISPKEAEGMDPQERLFLEAVWTLLEDAAVTPGVLTRADPRVGVFVGVMNRDYEWQGGAELAKGYIPKAYSTFSSIANRVSYFFNFQGPSLAVDTSCSSALTAVHLACESIDRGECHAAIAGGVNLIFHPAHYHLLSIAGMLSRDEKCKSFGAGADGFVPGEGIGAILLKPLERAIQERDRIYAVIRGTAVNAGGKTSGYQVPNPNAQANMVLKALADAGIDPGTINYIEAAAAGSSLGDPIEITGLSKAFAATRYKTGKQYCSIGSVKSNIGHLESASGMAGLTKVLLQMKYKQLVPSLHSEQVNPHIDFQESPFYVQQELAPWKQVEREENGEKKKFPRRASVSSFGAGGANAHIILEEYHEEDRAPGPEPPEENLQPQLIILSAKNQDRLKAYADSMKKFLENQEKSGAPVPLPGIAYTLQRGREPMEERLAIIISTTQALEEKLQQYSRGETGIENVYHGNINARGGKGEFLSREPEGKEMIRELIRQRKLSHLAQLWVSGWEIQWKLFYPGRVPPLVSLPTYPFKRQRYWTGQTLEPTQAMDSTGEKVHQNRERSRGVNLPGNFFYQPCWEPAPLPQTPGPQSTGGQTVIIIYPDPAAELVEALADAHAGDEITRIKLGTRARKISKKHREINTRNPAAMDGIIGGQKEINRIYFLGGIIIGEDHREIHDLDLLEKFQEQGILQLFRLLKSLTGHGNTGTPLHLVVITNDVYQVEPGERTLPYSASLLGLARTMVSEYFQWKISCLDISLKGKDKGTPRGEYGSLVESILAEPPLREPEEVALRNQKRYKRIFKPRELPPVRQTPFKHRGVYLILGGAGGIGLELSQYLARTVRARMVLIDVGKLEGPRKEKIAAIEAQGGEVLYLQANGTDLQNMTTALKKAKARFGNINGAIHSAIVLRDRTLQNMDETALRAALDPKVNASVVLNRVLQQEPLDFMMFFSSGNSFSCKPGQANYNAGCAFKDAYAQRLRQEKSYPVQTINWGYWGSVGIVAAQKYSQQFAARGIGSITPQEGMEAVHRVLAHREPQVLALKAEARALEKLGLAPGKITFPPQHQHQEKPPPIITNQNNTNKHKMEIEKQVRRCAAEILAMDPQQIDKEKPFSQYGVNSIIGIKMVTKINETFRILLRTTAIFDYANVKDLSRYIYDQYGEAVLGKITGESGPGKGEPAAAQNISENDDELMTLLRRLEKGETSARQVEQLIK